MNWRERRRARKTAKLRQCRIDEEWCGSFIGRRFCATHDVYWDNGGNCPKYGQPPWWMTRPDTKGDELQEYLDALCVNPHAQTWTLGEIIDDMEAWIDMLRKEKP